MYPRVATVVFIVSWGYGRVGGGRLGAGADTARPLPSVVWYDFFAQTGGTMMIPTEVK